MNTLSIKFEAAKAYRARGFQPPPNRYLTRDRCIWIGKMYELEQREMVQDD